MAILNNTDQSPRITRSSLLFWLTLVVITVYAGALRLYKLDEYPQLVTKDEMVQAYDAWSIWQTGRDHSGALLPLHVYANGENIPPVSVYLVAPFVGLLGLSEFTTRLPLALAGTGAVFFVGLLARRWAGPVAGLVAALSLALSPWHINFSRFGIQASLLPFITVLALYCFSRAMTALNDLEAALPPGSSVSLTCWRVTGWLALSGLCFALQSETYFISILQTPLLVGCCLVAAAPTFRHHRKLAVFWIGIIVVLTAPYYLDHLLHWQSDQYRFSGVSAMSLPNWPFEALRLYVEHFDPGRLMITGFHGSITFAPRFTGFLFWLDIPLGVIAVIALLKGAGRRFPAFSLALLLGLWLLTYPVADALTVGDGETVIGHPNEGRSIDLLPLPELAAGIGAAVLVDQLTRRRWTRPLIYVFAAGTGILVIAWSVAFIPAFFFTPLRETNVPAKDVPANIGLSEVVTWVKQQAQPCDVIWMEPPRYPLLIYYLYYAKTPPALVQRLGISPYQMADIFLGKPDPSWPDPSPQPDCANQRFRIYSITTEQRSWQGWLQVDGSAMRNGTPLWRVYMSLHDPLPYTPAPLDFGGKIQLLGYELASAMVSPGQTAAVRPHWQQLSPMQANYTMFIHLYPADKVQVLAQLDAPPVPDPYSQTSRWSIYSEPMVGLLGQLTIPATLPPGKYRLAIGLYDYASGIRLAAPDGTWYQAIPITVVPATVTATF